MAAPGEPSGLTLEGGTLQLDLTDTAPGKALEQRGGKCQSCHLAASNSIGAVCADDGGASSPGETQSVYHGHGTKSQSSRSPFQRRFPCPRGQQ
ncbi:hypothetical protein PTT_02914 [Pyrenophora teres f. teres 0-1]|uniref:Uncharacterized protein n=1 Tax=Pyrenophora teres f. teres (strain 0-1) TaxID=861557 RepID=E3RDT3_PYRTT|nr:hypothetical protein PTT_02914 [Pyrenophora teres f. teres 0-1]